MIIKKLINLIYLEIPLYTRNMTKPSWICNISMKDIEEKSKLSIFSILLLLCTPKISINNWIISFSEKRLWKKINIYLRPYKKLKFYFNI